MKSRISAELSVNIPYECTDDSSYGPSCLIMVFLLILMLTPSLSLLYGGQPVRLLLTKKPSGREGIVLLPMLIAISRL